MLQDKIRLLSCSKMTEVLRECGLGTLAVYALYNGKGGYLDGKGTGTGSRAANGVRCVFPILQNFSIFLPILGFETLALSTTQPWSRATAVDGSGGKMKD